MGVPIAAVVPRQTLWLSPKIVASATALSLASVEVTQPPFHPRHPNERVTDSAAQPVAEASTTDTYQEEHPMSNAVTDPVCGMSIDPNGAATTAADYQGATYYFCSRHCHETFAKDPAAYAGAGHQGHTH